MNSAPSPDRPDAPESPVDSAMPLLDRLSGFTSLGMTHAPGRLHLLTRLSAGLCVAAVIGLVLLPWRQFVSGSGRVIAFNPLERHQGGHHGKQQPSLRKHARQCHAETRYEGRMGRRTALHS